VSEGTLDPSDAISTAFIEHLQEEVEFLREQLRQATQPVQFPPSPEGEEDFESGPGVKAPSQIRRDVQLKLIKRALEAKRKEKGVAS
jgi:hypothetical protein